MQPTPVKINKSSANGSESAKTARNTINLTDGPLAKTPTNGLKKYLWLLLILVAAQAAAIAWLYLLKPISPYQKLLPPNAVATAYFNQNTLLNLTKSQLSADSAWPPLAWGEAALKNFLSQNKIEGPEQILALFADQMALAILPQTGQNNPPWLILSLIKVPGDQFSRSRDQIEQALKQNYNLTSEPYRQIKISQVQPLKDNKLSLLYAEANGYFILANSKELIKTILDRIIK